MNYVLWITGLPCSGKTTLGKKLNDVIKNLAVLDGDELRKWLSKNDFSKEGITDHNKRVAYLAKLLFEHNVPVCVCMISPYNEIRETTRNIIGKDNFIEIYLKCSIETCESRDVKGMYKKARNKEIKNFIGVDSQYEIPSNPNIVLDTENRSIIECVNVITDYLKNNFNQNNV